MSGKEVLIFLLFLPHHSEKTSWIEQTQEKVPFATALKPRNPVGNETLAAEWAGDDSVATDQDQELGPGPGLVAFKHEMIKRKVCCDFCRAADTPRGHEPTQLTGGDNVHLIPGPNSFVIVTRRSSCHRHNSCATWLLRIRSAVAHPFKLPRINFFPSRRGFQRKLVTVYDSPFRVICYCVLSENVLQSSFLSY